MLAFVKCGPILNIVNIRIAIAISIPIQMLIVIVLLVEEVFVLIIISKECAATLDHRLFSA